jgi:hypothetical protein
MLCELVQLCVTLSHNWMHAPLVESSTSTNPLLETGVVLFLFFFLFPLPLVSFSLFASFSQYQMHPKWHAGHPCGPMVIGTGMGPILCHFDFFSDLLSLAYLSDSSSLVVSY